MVKINKNQESQENFVARRQGAHVSLEDLADEVLEHVDDVSRLYAGAFIFICAKKLFEDRLKELGFVFWV